MSITNLAVKRPVATVMFFVGIILIGAVSFKNLTIDLLPSLGYPKLGVFTTYEGASSEEIEKFITSPLESLLSSIPGIKRVSSISKEGFSVITLEFYWGTNMEFAFLRVKEKIQEAKELLPRDCKTPVILDWDPSSKPIVVAVVETKKGNLIELRETAELLIKPRLEQIEGVSRVEVVGSGEREVVVSVEPEKLFLYDVNFNEIERALKEWNQIVLGGTVLKDKIKYVFKVEGEVKNINDIKEIPVKEFKGRKILIKDIANVEFKEKLKEGEVRFNGEKSVSLLIFKESDANTVNATRKIKEAFGELKNEFPEIGFKIVSEEAGLIVSSINSLKKSIIYGSILAFIVLVLFLKNIKDPILVAVVIPIAVISTFVLMFFAGVNINIMSLGGLALGVGMFVDNSIVVIESIYRKKESTLSSAVSGTEEVASAITASTITTIVIFLPVLYIYGVTGRLFRDQALTVSFSLLSSLFVSLTLLPSLYNAFLGKKEFSELKIESYEKSKILTILHTILLLPFYIPYYFFKALGFLGFKKLLNALYKVLSHVFKAFKKAFELIFKSILILFDRGYSSFYNVYHKFLEYLLNRKLFALLLGMIFLGITVLFYSGLKKELLPKPESQTIEVEILTPSEFGFDETNMFSKIIEEKISKIDGVKYVFSRTGITSKLSDDPQNTSVNRIFYILKINGRKKRGYVEKKVRYILSQYPSFRYSIREETNTLSRYLQFGKDSIEIKVYFEVFSDAKRVVSEIKEKLKKIKGLSDIRTNMEAGKPILSLQFRKELMNSLGIKESEITDYINSSLRGKIVSSLRKVQKSYDILLSTDLRYKKDIEKLLKTHIRKGKKGILLGELVYLKKEESLKEIYRDSQERYFSVFANLSGKKLSDVSPKIERILNSLNLPSGVRVKLSGEEEERKRAFSSLNEAVLLAIILVYMVMASQFENLLHPLIIMFSLPMGFSGAFLLLYLSGETLNVISGIGLLVMVGIVVNDAIVKVDYTNRLIRDGMRIREAILEASRVRLRPILMTTFTTIFGLLPMALMHGEGSELQRPLSIVVIGGLLFSTFLTLIFIPVLYEWVMNLIKKER